MSAELIKADLKPTRYWIFQATQSDYNLEKHLVPEERVDWKLLRLEEKVAEGDVVYFWLAGSEEAILGWGVVEGEPYANPEDSGHHRVPVRYQVKLSNPLTRTMLKKDRWLARRITGSRRRWACCTATSHCTRRWRHCP